MDRRFTRRDGAFIYIAVNVTLLSALSSQTCWSFSELCLVVSPFCCEVTHLPHCTRYVLNFPWRPAPKLHTVVTPERGQEYMRQTRGFTLKLP